MQRNRSLIIRGPGNCCTSPSACSWHQTGGARTPAAHRLGMLPTLLRSLGVLAMFAASILLARESTLAVKAVNEEMDHRHVTRHMDAPPSP